MLPIFPKTIFALAIIHNDTFLTPALGATLRITDSESER